MFSFFAQINIASHNSTGIALAWMKHQKEFIKDLRTVYGAVNKDSAAANLDLLESKIWEKNEQCSEGNTWAKKDKTGALPYYASSLTSWRANAKRRQGYLWNHKSIVINIYILIWQRYIQKVSYSNYMSKRLFYLCR